MNTALPIMVVVGDKWSARCVITGGAIKKAIFSTTVEKEGSGSLPSVSGITVSTLGDKITINCAVEITDYTLTSNTVTFILPSQITARIKPGNYSYNISVIEANTENTNDEQVITPVYTNAFNVYARVNAINPTPTNN